MRSAFTRASAAQVLADSKSTRAFFRDVARSFFAISRFFFAMASLASEADSAIRT